MAAVNLPYLPSGTLESNPQQWESYFVQLQEQLAYGFGNIDTENYSASHKDAISRMQDAASRVGEMIQSLQYTASSYALQQLTDKLDGEMTIFYSATEPVEKDVNDIWYDESVIPARVRRWNGTLWSDITDTSIGVALMIAKDARAVADGKIRTYYQDNEPTGADYGDLWFDTSNNNEMKMYDGSMWVSAQNNALNNVYLTAEGVNVKSADGRARGVFTSTGILFYQQDSYMGGWVNGKLVANVANVYDQLTLGTSTKHYYDFIVDQGRLTVKYRA